MQAINDFILAAAGQPWVLVLVFACCVIDGFFPPIPSESVVVGLAAVAATADVPNPALLAATAAAGAFLGDNIAYLIGRRAGTRRWAWMRGPRMQAAFRWAGRGTAETACLTDPRGALRADRPGGRQPDRRCHALPAGTLRRPDGALGAAVGRAIRWGSACFFGQWFEENHVLGAPSPSSARSSWASSWTVVISKAARPLPGGRRTAGPVRRSPEGGWPCPWDTQERFASRSERSASLSGHGTLNVTRFVVTFPV